VRFKGKSKRGIFIIGMVLLILVSTVDTFASPLYGGYNGKSENWFEIFIIEKATIGFYSRISVGLAPDLNVFWIRLSISSLFLLPSNISNIGFSYERGDVVAGDIVSVSLSTIVPPIKVGIDTNNLKWIITNLLISVVGSDSEDNMWLERGISGVGACGEDSNDKQWCWLKFLPLLVGWRVDFPLAQDIFLNRDNDLRFEENLRSLKDHFAKACNHKLSALLIEKLTDDEIMVNIIKLSEVLNDRITLLPLNILSTQQNREEMLSGLKALLTYVDKNIFTDELREEASIILDNFNRDTQLRSYNSNTTLPAER